MNIDKMMETYKNENRVTVSEAKLLETIQVSKDAMLQAITETPMSYLEFLYAQLHFIRKRWWVLQAILLLMTYFLIPSVDDSANVVKTLGIVGVLFVVMITPELWRNKENDSLQIEATCLFSLRMIYAARILLIGIVDIFMITVFVSVSYISMRLPLVDIMVQFLFPMVVTAGICFGMLSNKWINEATSILGCFIWSVIWWCITINEAFYESITVLMWGVLFFMSVCFLIGSIYKTIHDCNHYLEVNLNGITNS